MQPDDCNMSFFDQIAAQIIGEVQQTKAFRKLEDTMLPVKEHMSGALPGLSKDFPFNAVYLFTKNQFRSSWERI